MGRTIRGVLHYRRVALVSGLRSIRAHFMGLTGGCRLLPLRTHCTSWCGCPVVSLSLRPYTAPRSPLFLFSHPHSSSRSSLPHPSSTLSWSLDVMTCIAHARLNLHPATQRKPHPGAFLPRELRLLLCVTSNFPLLRRRRCIGSLRLCAHRLRPLASPLRRVPSTLVHK